MNQRQKERERLLYLYSRALEECDLDAMDRVDKAATGDPELGRLLNELEEAHYAEIPELALAEPAATVRALLREHLPSADTPTPDLRPITVGEVVHKLRADRGLSEADAEAAARLADEATPVPARLSLSELRRLGLSLGVRANETFWRRFRDAAVLLGLSQSQQVAFAAARRQQTPTKKEPEEP